jgi:hypothetical protein
MACGAGSDTAGSKLCRVATRGFISNWRCGGSTAALARPIWFGGEDRSEAVGALGKFIEILQRLQGGFHNSSQAPTARRQSRAHRIPREDEMRPYKKFGRQFLDRKSDGIRGFGKTPVAHRPVSLGTARRKKLTRGAAVTPPARFNFIG